MNIKCKEINTTGTKFYVELKGQEVGRTYLYILFNDSHKRPFEFIEDIFADEILRGRGVGSELVKKVIEEAKQKDCYKLICTSRYGKQKVHGLYTNLNFKEQGKEFHIDF